MKPLKKAVNPIALILAAGMIFCSCGGQQAEKQGESTQKQDQEKALKTLEEIESINETIIMLLNGPAKPGKTEDRGQGNKQQDQDDEQQKQQQDDQQNGQQPEQSPGKEEAQGQQKEQQGQEQQRQGKEQQGQEQQGQQQDGEQGKEQQGQQDEKQGKDQQGQQQQQGKSQQGQQGQPQETGIQEQNPQDMIWDEVNNNIIELHSLLNEYIPAAAKLGASAEMASNASNALNMLTKRAEAKDHNEVLTEANNLYKAICDYYALHQDKRAPAKLLLFHARKIMLSARTGDWGTAQKAMEDLKESWNTQKNSLGSEQKEIAAMLDLSVSDLAGAVKEKNQNLAAIKGLVLLQNITELEGSLEQK